MGQKLKSCGLENKYNFLTTDITTLMRWTSEVDTFEEDIFTLLKFQHQDSIKVKEHHLKLERCRDKVGQCKKV
jgi:hypothetical protein